MFETLANTNKKCGLPPLPVAPLARVSAAGFFIAMTEPDYFAINRRLLKDDDLWLCEPFTRGQAWVDLIGLARWQDGSMRVRGNLVRLKRGQVGWSKKGLATRWRWSQGKVARFLKELENGEQIVEHKSNVTTVLTIVNYDKYQRNGEQNGEQTVSRQRADGEQTVTKEEGQERKRRSKKSPPNPQGDSHISAREFFDRWNGWASKRPKMTARVRMTEKLRKQIEIRLRDPQWFVDFQLALAQLPLGGDGWQPSLEWLLRNEDNVYRLLEGEFKWRNTDDPATERRQANLRKLAADEREQRLADERRNRQATRAATREAIENTLFPTSGSVDEQPESNLLSGLDEDLSSANGAERPSPTSGTPRNRTN